MFRTVRCGIVGKSASCSAGWWRGKQRAGFGYDPAVERTGWMVRRSPVVFDRLAQDVDLAGCELPLQDGADAEVVPEAR